MLTRACPHHDYNFSLSGYQLNTLDTFTQMLIGYCITQISLRPLLHYFHWSPGCMAIFKLLFVNYHSRKHVTSHTFVISNSLLID